MQRWGLACGIQLCLLAHGCQRGPEPRHPERYYVEAAANYIVRNDRRVSVETPLPDGSVRVRPLPTIPYPDGAALLAANTDCCVIGHTPGDSAPPPCVENGKAVEVSVRWRRHFVAEDGTPQSKIDLAHVGVLEDGSICTADEGVL